MPEGGAGHSINFARTLSAHLADVAKGVPIEI